MQVSLTSFKYVLQCPPRHLAAGDNLHIAPVIASPFVAFTIAVPVISVAVVATMNVVSVTASEIGAAVR